MVPVQFENHCFRRGLDVDLSTQEVTNQDLGDKTNKMHVVIWAGGTYDYSRFIE